MTFHCILESLPDGAVIAALVGPSTDPNYAALADDDPRVAEWPLAQAKAQQTAAVKADCSVAIQGGFQSAALGAMRTYPSTLIPDQHNMTGSCVDAQRAPPDWQADTEYLEGADCIASGVRLIAVTGGTSGASAPADPGSVTATVQDGTVTWSRWSTPFWVMDSQGEWSFAPHAAAQILRAGADLKAFIVACQRQCASLTALIAAETTVTAVQAITWSTPRNIA